MKNNYSQEQIIKLAEWYGYIFFMYDDIDLPESPIWVKNNNDIFKFNLSDWNIINKLEEKMIKELGIDICVYGYNHDGDSTVIYRGNEETIRSGYGEDRKHAVINTVLQHIEGKA
jgi:hypothetical protein